MRELYFGDCLDVLRELSARYPQGFIDLIYIDPPSNSQRNYNVLFESIEQKDVNAQKQAFADTWSNVSYLEEKNALATLHKDLYDFIDMLDRNRSFSRSAVSYITLMAHRIVYMHRALKPTGSFYLHCDPTMSHYLKLVCDVIFEEKHFRNEIIWKRTTSHNDAKKYPRVSDTIFFYSKSEEFHFNTQYIKYTEEYLKRFRNEDADGRRWMDDNLTAKGLTGGGYEYEYKGAKSLWRVPEERMVELDAEGRLHFTKNGGIRLKRYLDEAKGNPVTNIWDDIRPINSQSQERLGYPTQKPTSLLKRIVESSSKPGDVVADFFCGCGTTVAAAEELGRQWVGSDISHLAIRLILKRVHDTYGEEVFEQVKVHGFPRDVASAGMLAKETQKGPFNFQNWAIEVLLGGVSNEKKTGDGGYDGYLTFEMPEKREFVFIETKNGKVTIQMVWSFIQTVNEGNASIGFFVCFAPEVTPGMREECARSGYFRSDLFETRYPRIQIVTIEDLLEGKRPRYPESLRTTFKSAERKTAKQTGNELF